MDTVYALRDEVQELKQVSPYASCKCLFILNVLPCCLNKKSGAMTRIL